MPDAPGAESLGYLAAILLGVVQGATEFLPVSSSDHLALAQQVGLGHKVPLIFDLLLHVATVAAVFKAFWKDFWRYLTRERAVMGWIVLACAPTALGGLAFKDHFEAMGHCPRAVCAMLLVTAAILLAGHCLRPGERPLERLGGWRALAVGAAQGLAIAPGISRSGTTLVAGMAAGLSRDDAVKFSFSLMVPAVLGASLLEAVSGYRHWKEALANLPGGAPVPSMAHGLAWGPCAAGFLAALATGIASLSLLRRVVEKRALPAFAAYCAAVAVAGLAYFTWRP